MWNDSRQLNLLANALYSLLALALLAVAGYWLVQQPKFTLRVIKISGEMEHINMPTVRAALMGQVRGNFFTVDLETVRTAIESMPWVRQASVQRVWPNQLAITLQEYKAVGLWGSDQLVSEEGELFTANQAEADDGLPLLNGPVGSEKKVVDRYRDFKRWLAPLGSAPQVVTLSTRYAWRVELANGMRLDLGRERERDTLEVRCQRLVAAWPEVTKQWGRDIEYVDLRYPNGFAIHTAGMSFVEEINNTKGQNQAVGNTAGVAAMRATPAIP